jgi:PAS domain S-box-containing protein
VQETLRTDEQALRKVRDELEARVAERTAELRRSETELRDVIDTIPAIVWSALPDGSNAYVNNRFVEYLGISAERTTGSGWEATIHTDDLQAHKAKWLASLAIGKPFESEVRLRRADGRYRWHLDRGVPIRDDSGNVVKWYGVLTDIEDRKRAEEHLRRIQFYLSEGQRLAHMGSWAFNPRGFFDYWSHELFQIYGLDPQRGAPTLQRYLAAVHPQDREFMARTMRKLTAAWCGFDMKVRIVRPNGELRHVRCVGTPVMDGGVLTGFLGTAVDITEQELLTQELERRQVYLTEAQTLTHTGSWAYNYVSGKYTYYSDEMFRIYGLSPRGDQPPELEEIVKRIHPEDYERMREEIGRVVREKLDYREDFRIALPDGRVKYLQSFGHPTLNEAGELVQHSGTALDVTERRRVEQRLLADQQVARILSEVSTVEEATPKILRAMCECLACHLGVFWRAEGDVLRCVELWHQPHVEAAEFEAATRASTFAAGSGLPGRVWASRKPAHVSDVVYDPEFYRGQSAAHDGLHAAFALPVLLGDEVLGVIELFSRDIWVREDALLTTMATIGSQIGQFMERKRAENALQLAQAELARVARVMTMGELTASIAHEINQPLGAIVASAASCRRWLAAEPPRTDKALRALKRIVNDGSRASEVIGRIRTLMKRQAPRKEWQDINRTILEVIAIAQYQLRRNDVVLETRLADNLPPVEGDRVQLQQVLLNLIVNAIEAMSGITARPRELTIVSATDGTDAVRVEVRDSGPGMDRERATRVFEPFYTTKVEGIGIGLSISRSIIEAHCGRLSCAANEPHGAVFLFSLPVGSASWTRPNGCVECRSEVRASTGVSPRGVR